VGIRTFGGLEDFRSDRDVSVRGRLADAPVLVTSEVDGKERQQIKWALEEVTRKTEDNYEQKVEKWSIFQPWSNSNHDPYAEAIYPQTKAAGIDLNDVSSMSAAVGKILTFERKRVERVRVGKGKDGKKTYLASYQRTKREQDETGEWQNVTGPDGKPVKETATYEDLFLVKIE
jgi:hypothetical protein